MGGERVGSRGAGRRVVVAACLVALTSGLCLAPAAGDRDGLRATAAAAPPVAYPERPSAEAQARPNILVLLTDDMRLDELRWMPRTRRLIGDRGVTYRRAFSENPLCCPFRAALLTGQYGHNNDVLGNAVTREGGYLRLHKSRNLHTALQASGYRTAWLGKYLNEYPEKEAHPRYVPPGWSAWHGATGWHYDYGDVEVNHNGRLQRHPGHKADVYGRLGSRMIGRLARREEPFFAVVSYLAPHFGLTGSRWHHPVAAPRHRGRLVGRMPGLGPAFDEPDVSDKPAYVRAARRFPVSRLPHLRRLRRVRAESLLSVDEAVARNLRALRRSGELADTIVVFTSDNGHLLGEHRIVDKRVPYEESIRIPLLVRGPGFTAGRVERGLVGAVDLGSTVAAAGGVAGDLPYPLDGRDLRNWPTLTRGLLLEGGPGLLQQHVVRARRSYTGLRTRRYLYVRYSTGEEELYDLWVDRHQRRSRHADPGYTDVRARLRGRLRHLRDCVGTAACRGG